MENKKEKKQSILTSLLLISVVPLVVLGICMAYMTWNSVYKATLSEAQNTLSVAAHAGVDELNLLYPGALSMADGVIKKGDQNISDAYELLDAFHQNNKLDLTLFYDGKSIMSTIEGYDDEHAFDAPDDLLFYVGEKHMEYYSHKLTVGGVKQVGYCIPVGSDSLGMLLVCEPLFVIVNHANTIALKTIMLSIIVLLIVCVICVIFVNRLGRALRLIKDFLGMMADKKNNTGMSKEVTSRRDEIGEIGRYAVQVNADLDKLIYTDPLTGLYNRRAGRIELQKRIDAGRDLTVVMGDIDFFKKVNDTYGHECGDIVLKKVSATIADNMKERGFASRWGGEEFVLVFDKPYNLAYDATGRILNQIRAILFDYEDIEFQVTMTFGVTPFEEGMDIDEILRIADEKLYYGKMHGRNCVIGHGEELEKEES